MISKNGFRLKQISSLFIVMCILLTMLPVTAFAESVYIADSSALPIHDDILEIQEGVLKDGVLVIDLGDYDEFLASIANGERFPITITRPKGSEAGYPITAMFDSYSGSNANGFRIFDTGEGDNYSRGFIEFPPNVTSKTIYIGQEYDLGDNTLRSGTLSSYIYFHTFDKTTLATPMIRLETTKEKSTGVDTTGLLPVVYAQVSDTTMSVNPYVSKVIAVTFLPTRNIFLLDRGFCEITGDLALNLKRGTQTLVLKPVEAIGSILSDVTFVLPPTDPISEDWEVVSITGIKNAANNDIIDLIYSDVYSESDINASTYTFRYDYEPVFGPITTDKESYKGLENIQVSLPVQNADQINFGADFNDYWIEQIGLSYDGGQNFIPQDSIGWNSTTKSIEATFTAPENNTARAFDIALEVYRSYGEMMTWQGFYNAFKYIEIAPETADFIPVESITVTGIPALDIKCDNPYPLEVAISPGDATFQGYTWQSDNPDQAQVIGGNLLFYEEGKVNITLISEERAYRMEQELPANDDVLVKTFTFFAGTPHLITGQISVGKNDTTTAVTARFVDNFDLFQDKWKTPVLTYEIRKSDGSLVKSGNATRENDVTEVKLVFDDTTPKAVSLYENGEFKPTYTITLNASAGTESVSATANVYITPPPVTMESLTETSNALVGEPSTFVFRIKNLLPGYMSRYEILGGGTLEEGALTKESEELDPATGLITLTGSVLFTPTVQGFVSEFRTITVYAGNMDEKPQAISKRINVVDQSTSRMSVEFCDGIDGTIIHPELGDEPDVFYGIRESKIVELTKDSAYAAQGIFEYLNRMMPTKTLKVTVPKEWGQMAATGASNPVTDYTDISLYLSFEDIGKKITLSWENVSTTKEFTFMEDAFYGKLYAFRLVNAHSLQPVSISYKNGVDQPVNKNVTPYNGYVILYEPTGIEGDVWFSQESGTGSYMFASITSVAALRKIDRSWQREYDQAPLVVSSLITNHRYITGHSTPAFTADTVILSEPMARFSNAGNIIPTVVRYGAIDDDGKIISNTSGKISSASNSEDFQIPFQVLYENPNAQLLVEFEYSVATGSRTQLATYDVQTLEENLRYKKVNNYIMTSSDNIQYITATGKDGQTRYLPISSNIMKKLLPEDTLEVHLATGTRAIERASLDIVNYQPVSDGNGNTSHWMPDFTAVSEATGIVEADRAELTPNKYTTLRFKPTTRQMTPGLVTQITVNIVFTDGTSDQYSMGWGQMADTGTAEYVKLITDILKSQTLIHEEQRVIRMGDAQVMRNTRDAKVEGVKVSFNQDVAALFDKINVDIALPPENPSNPFTFEVIPRGDEFDIRGYVNASIMNKAGWVNLADRWPNASFNDVFDATKQEVKSTQYGSFPGAKGYLEGKAVVTPSGELRITFHEGKIIAQSHLLYKPSDLFSLGYYCEWGIAFEGMVKTIMEIKAPDNNGDPTSPVNFNLVEDSYVKINVLTGNNALSFDIGVYALDIGLHGGILASYRQKSIYRPYAEGSQKLQRGVSFSTAGDLMARNYNRIKTDLLDSSEITENVWSIWNSRIRYFGRTLYGFCDFLVPNDQSNPLSWNFKPNIKSLSAAMSSFSLHANSIDFIPRQLSADPLTTIGYYKNGTGIVYRGSTNSIITSAVDGSSMETVEDSAFSLDIASNKNGSSIAAWGSYRDDLKTLDPKTTDTSEIIKYMAGMTEIKAGIYNGTGWDIKTLSNNKIADITPKVATNGNTGIVIWTQGIPDSNGLEVMEFSESRLMFAQYKNTAWSEPARLFLPTDQKIVEYSVAMADDGSALATVVTSGGKIVMIRISIDSEITLINNSLPPTDKISLIYNGKTYTLACYNAKSMGLSLVEISADGFVMNTTFTDLPTNIGEDFRLFRDRSQMGVNASVLVWPGYSEDDNSQARIFASRISAADHDHLMLVTSPITAAIIKTPSTTGSDAQVGVFVLSYDAYIEENDLKILTLFRESTSGGTEGSVYLDEAQARFENIIETDSGMNDITGLLTGIEAIFNINVKNKGFLPITSIHAKIGNGESTIKTVRLLPNDQTTVKAAFIPTRDLPDSIEYTVTAVFSDGSECTATGSIRLGQVDIEAKIILQTLENDNYAIKGLISNNTSFSLLGKTVIAGIYQDPFGKLTVVEEKIDGSKFESESMGISYLVDLSFANSKDLPQSLYFIAKAYDSTDHEIPDTNSLNNIWHILNDAFGSATNPNDDEDDSPSGSVFLPGNTSSTSTIPANAPDRPVTAVAFLTATLGANGAASAFIPENIITDAIAKAQAVTRAQGRTAPSTSIALNVTMPMDATSLTAILTQSSLNTLVSAGVSGLELNGGPVSLTLDLKALQEIQKQSDGKISLFIAPFTGLSGEAKSLLDNRPVYKITISYMKDGKTVYMTDLGNGTATLSIPYIPGKDEAVGYLFGVYVDSTGKALRMPGSFYDANSKGMIVPTGHFSVFGVGYTAPSNKFSDIGTHWGKNAMDYVIGRGLLMGTSETTFAPNTAMTRGMLITVLGRLAGVNGKDYTTNNFTDVIDDSAFCPYIEWGTTKGIIQGIGNQQFAPNRAITREEIAVVFTNYAKAMGYKLPVIREASIYSDASGIGGIYITAVTAMQQAGIMTGDTDNRFKPKSNATRAEVATMLLRYIKLTVDPATAQGWALNDIGQWHYYKAGKALTGAQTIDGVRYIFETTGVLKTGWVKDDDNWRFYYGNKAATGWLDISDKRYYFTNDGLMVSGKWLQIDGDWYYFYTDGALARSTVIDGYEINPDGVRKNK